MGHRDLATTERYADYAPSERAGEMVVVAFAREVLDAAASVRRLVVVAGNV